MPKASSSVISEQPWWVKTFVYVGAPTAAAGFLLWFVVSVLSAQLDGLTKSMQTHQSDMAQLVRHLDEESQQSWVTASVLARICINTAKNDADRLACVTVSRKPQ